jgi:Tfp pilus assembly protein PilF
VHGSLRAAAALVAVAAGVVPALSQSREYRVVGTVVDTDKKPIAGASVEMREKTSRAGYKVTTDAHGAYKMVGLPHGVYEVTVSKDGYTSRTDEWNLAEPQDTLKKVEINPYVLLSAGQVQEMNRNSRLRSELDEAVQALRKGDTDTALAALGKMLAEQPDDANAHYLTGLCRMQRGEDEAAATSLQRAVELSPGFAAAHTNLGICYERLKDSDRAVASYEKALAVEPDNAVALYNLGVLRYNATKPTGALACFRRILQSTPDDDHALEMAGYCELQLQEYDKALADLERARSLVKDAGRADAIDEVLKELRPHVQPTPAGGA